MSRFVTGGAGGLGTPPPSPAPEPDALAVVSSFGRHPSIAAQPSTGRVPLDAVLYDGKVFVGYGDWTENTGPIDIVYLDTATGLHGTALEDAPTEAIGCFRTIGGKLFTPWTDSHVSMPYLGYSTDFGGVWRNVDNGKTGALHLFDAASYTGDPGTDLYLCGSDIIDGQGHGIVYHTINAGATWTLAFDQGSPGGYARIYSIVKYGTSLWAVGNATYRFNGAAWSQWLGPWELGSGKALETQGVLVSAVGWFDGTNSAQHVDPADPATPVTFAAVTVDELDRLWGVYSNHLYHATVDGAGVHWTRVGHLNWDDFMPSKIVVDSTAGLLYVVAADCTIRTTTLPAV